MSTVGASFLRKFNAFAVLVQIVEDIAFRIKIFRRLFSRNECYLRALINTIRN